jgi:hypothetical protein
VLNKSTEPKASNNLARNGRSSRKRYIIYNRSQRNGNLPEAIQ